MYAEEGVGVCGAQVFDVALEETMVGGAEAGPEHHVIAVGAVDVIAEGLIWDEEDFAVFWERSDHFGGVGRGATNINFGFDGGGAVDIGDSQGAGVMGFER